MGRADGRMTGVLGQLRDDVLNVYPYRCAVVRNRNASCRRCADACTGGAIRIDEDEVSIDVGRCCGCGTCATVCPTCAIEAASPNDAELLVAARDAHVQLARRDVPDLAEGVPLAIACDAAFEAAAGSLDPATTVRVRCLGRVDESLLVGAAAQGMRSVVLLHGACEGCARATGRATWLRTAAMANQLLKAWGSQARVSACTEPPVCLQRDAFSGDEAPGRKCAGRLGEADGGDGGAEGLLGHAAVELPERLHAMADGTLPHFLPDRRERLLDALAALGEPDDVVLQGSSFGRVQIDAGQCRTCFMCATFCPTGALARFADEDGTVGVEHVASECVACGTCADVCPKCCLELLYDVPARDVASGGVTQRHVLPPMRAGRNEPSSMFHAVKGLMGIKDVYQY